MKALLLGAILALPFSSLLPQEQATLSVMPPAATGISHGYALWTTGQIENPYGCVFGSAHPEQGVVIYSAGPAPSPQVCNDEENAIGMLIFLHDSIPQEQACEVAQGLRNEFPSLVLFGAVHGLEVRELLSGDVYTYPTMTWCATPIEVEQDYRPPSNVPSSTT